MKKRTAGRPSGVDPSETRRQILDAGRESFAASGYAGATTRHIASRAGVNVATLHYHFGSKEGLYRASLDATAAGGALPEALPGIPPAERLARLVEGLHDYAAARSGFARLWLLDLLTGPTRQAIEPGAAEPRVALLATSLATLPGASQTLDAYDAARLIVTLLDASLADGNGARHPESARDAARAGVVAAALRIAGLG